jgi:PAS domain S-box-containing protein
LLHPHDANEAADESFLTMELRFSRATRWAEWWRGALAALTVAALVSLAAANVRLRATWHDVEDGVLWLDGRDGVVATEVAPGSAGATSGLRPGDLLLGIDDRPVEHASQVNEILHGAGPSSLLTYSILRLGSREALRVGVQPVPSGDTVLYFVLAAVAIFTLLVGLSVRLRRPSDQSTLHFFWLCVAFFGVFAFSFSGRLDRLDWVFYWADVIALLLLPPLFVHFTLVFPERPRAWVRTPPGRALWPLLYVPALLLGGTRVLTFFRVPPASTGFSRMLERLDRLELVYLAVCLISGLWILFLTLRRSQSPVARRQLRWIIWGVGLGTVPFVFGYMLPWAAGWTLIPRVELTVLPLALVPLAFASAIVRYRLMDVEVIIKRGLVYAAAVAAIAAMYTVLLQLAGVVVVGESSQHNTIIAILASLVVVLLAPPVKTAIQNTLDRAYYRDRYDYRRALVGFARDLNSDLDLDSLGDRLVARVVETLLVDRMALLLAPAEPEGAAFSTIRATGFEQPPPPLNMTSGIGARLVAGHTVGLDDPATARRFTHDEVAFWRERGVHYFVPCVSKEGTIAVMALGPKETGEPLSSEDVALLAAVAGQIATTLENGRLYGQLRQKATELDRMREFSESIIESLNEGLLVVDLDDRVIRWNHPLERLYGVAQADALGRRLDGLFDSPFLEAFRAARREAPGGSTVYRLPLVTRHCAGARRSLVNAATVPLLTPGGSISGTIVILEDVTTRVALEEQLQISEKMASIGLLAAGVAHEVNTPLTGISSFTQMLLEGADEEDPRTRLLEKIERQTFRAAKIVNGLLNLARPARAEAGPVDVNAVINDVLSVLEHQLQAANIKVRKDLATPVPIVRGVEHKLQQVFLNLCINARDAMPRGGWLSIGTRLEGDRVAVEVADTGGGIPSEHLSRIYDPFFTTKALGQGTGLGLAITYGIVQEHEGTITCQSAVGQGTRFILAFPLAPAARHEAGDIG